MKGLLKKDLILTVHTYWLFLPFIILFWIISIASEDFFFTIYPVVFLSALPMGLITVDEKCRWQGYANSMPYTRGEIVTSKYVFAGAIAITVTVLGIIVQTLSHAVKGTLTAAAAEEILLMLVFCPIMGLLIPCISLPCVFKFGIDKGKIAYLLLMGFAGGILGFMLSVTSDSFSEILTITAKIPLSVTICGGLGLAAAMFIISWAISIHAYKRRDL
ncbi:MAG: ABC-2 transporter permease [Ruminococcus sp.]|nr:ABC-2 transporter permease [Ruminococcus sp.]